MHWQDLQLSSDPNLLPKELQSVIRKGIIGNPRSRQTAIGPSEIGNPCLRSLAHKLADSPRRPPGAAWRPTVGTAVHAWLAEAFTAPIGAADRWAVETRVTVGSAAGCEISGTADLYDRCTATVVDWKVVGPTTLKQVRTNGPADVYRTQVHLYGNGFRNAGLPVERVAIMYLPAAGELQDSVWWSQPYSESVAAQGLLRLDSVSTALKVCGPEVAIPLMPTAEHYCGTCPFFSSSSSHRSWTSCPGHNAMSAARKENVA